MLKSTKYYLVNIALLLFVSRTLAQRGYKLEFGVMTGISNYLGEIGGKQGKARPWLLDLKLKKTRWNESAYIRYKFHPVLAVRVDVNYLRIEGSDALSSNPARKFRNLSFKNDIYDFETTLHWSFYSSAKPAGIYRNLSTYLNAHLFIGMGVFYHNPKALYQGSYIPLQPLQTEGVKYSKIGFCVPFGAGFFVALNKGRRSHRIGIEINWRYTNTDYLDDISQGKWINPVELSSATAAALNNRNPEITQQPPGMSGNYGWHGVKVNGEAVNQSKRGNPENKDSYISLNISYGVSLKGRYTRSKGKKIRTTIF